MVTTPTGENRLLLLTKLDVALKLVYVAVVPLIVVTIPVFM
jgi:hypothetical protein